MTQTDQPLELLTREQLALKLGVSVRTIVRWEKAKRLPVIRLSERTLRYSLQSVKRALEKRELRELA